MNILQAIILGIVQGVTEFLPVSSSGHLVLFQKILGMEGEYLFFDTMLHVATLVSVVIVLWAEVKHLLRHPIQKMMGMLIVATIPAIFGTLLFGDAIEAAFGGQWLAFAFIGTGILLVIGELIADSAKKRRTEVAYPDAVVMGVMQMVALVPGISRSGSTLTGGLFRGLDRSKAANFAFLMSIPVILGSVVYQGYGLLKDGVGADELYILPTIVGMIFAGVSGFLAVRFMLNLIRKKRLFGFAVYVVVLGFLVMLDQYFFHFVFATVS